MTRLVFLCSIVVILSLVSSLLASPSFDPYQVLGVSKKSSISEIRQAYKSLARKFHPDKNKDDDESESKFIDVNRAYDVLSDPERRTYFDKTGFAEDQPSFHDRREYHQNTNFDFDTFDSFFVNSERQRFKFASPNHYFRKHSVTFRAYENNIFPQSFVRPYILVFFGDLCPQCVAIEAQLPKIMRELESIGVGFASIDILHESSLARKIGVRTLPYMVSLIDGEIRPYREEKITLGNLIEFIRKSLPKNLISKVTDQTYEDFLGGWRDNKARVLFVNEDPLIKLRYFLIAFYFRERIVFGHVTEDSVEIRARYHIDPKKSSMLTFNEDNSRPVATLALMDLQTQFMKDVLDANKYLQLPRVTSQTMFDHLCPAGSLRSKVHLCVVLIASQYSDYEAKFDLMRAFMKESNFGRNRVRFMFMYREKQPQFIKTLSDGFEKINFNRGVHIVILWRREFDHVYYEWLSNEWDIIDTNYVNQTREKLIHLLGKLSQNVNQFGNEARINMLIDEDARSLFTRIFKRLVLVTENLTDNIAHTDPMPIVSVTISIIFIILVGYIMAYFMRIEEQNIRAQKWDRRSNSSTSFSSTSTSRCTESTTTNSLRSSRKNSSKYGELTIHELRGETYNGLVHLLKPGCRTLVLICDSTTRPALMQQFKKAVSPWRKNKTIYFAFIDIEKNLDWYRKILEQTLGLESGLNINPKNCVGTVLSLNGFRKYFCVYHAKHPEKRTNGSGAFLGMDDESGVDTSDQSDIESGMLMNGQIQPPRSRLKFYDDDEIILERNLLDGLKSWLNRLFEGQTTKYYISYWPENMK